ncbi:PREDICTED: keratin-associated protein 9-1-like [Papilio xuthus]|uniref:Keratin-associated protein 9-1-like n=1 Tax=Papilio xuthus TaxID=66420 RepID=A0AAJ6ZFD1_PAPXU|nr:PREDICTED: keratin-associated protein 9-1-like [Papilio xuthus]
MRLSALGFVVSYVVCYQAALTIGCKAWCTGGNCTAGRYSETRCEATCASYGCSAKCEAPSCFTMCNGASCLSQCTGKKCVATCGGVGCTPKCEGDGCEMKTVI